MKEKIKQLLYILRFITVAAGVDWNDEKMKKDIERWGELLQLKGKMWMILATLLFVYPEFRNLYIYRNSHRLLYRVWVFIWYKPMNTLFLQAGEIGGGLYIQHGFSTMVAAKSIGENCWINQQVTIGYRGKGTPPVIGNNVMISCGAKVLGEIVVGDNSVIGANAVVVKDVEPGAVMVGIPAKRVR